MKRGKQWLSGFLSAFAVLLLILDAKTASEGAKEGLQLCTDTLIPSLFPFLIFTNMIISAFVGTRIRPLSPIARLLGIPKGGESLLILGMLGGYPVGAQAVYDTYKSGQIDQNTAKRLLGFCSNAGPAFIFGIIGNLFTSPLAAWIVWSIHVLSAFLTGLMLPGKAEITCQIKQTSPISFPVAMKNSLRTMAVICGWVIIFRMIGSFLNRWILWMFPTNVSTCIHGILELTNGCIALKDNPSDGCKLVISCGLLALGGLCIWMQTVSVTKELGTGLYIPGKLLQCSISLLLAGLTQSLFLQPADMLCAPIIYILAACMLGALTILTRSSKKVVAL